MTIANCEIKRSDRGKYYEMKIDGKFYGNYDSVAEAAKDYDKNVNRCVCCGAIIPEGRQVCPICEQRRNR